MGAGCTGTVAKTLQQVGICKKAEKGPQGISFPTHGDPERAGL